VIAKITSLKDWTNRRMHVTNDVATVIRNDHECTMIWLRIFEVIQSRDWHDGRLTKKQLKKINHLIDDLNRQVIFAMVAGV
jgi:hypothetical protein